MLAAQRRDRIVDLVRRAGAVRVKELTRTLGVSDMTIRRDLEVLDSQGLLEKVHGGATVSRSSTDEPGFEAKWVRERQQKEAIAARAALLVEPGAAIALGAGTTTWTLAHPLRLIPRLTVVTNSAEIAEVFHQGPREDQTIVLTGGIRTPSAALVGPVAIGSLRSLNLDTVFIGAHGMDARMGFTTPNLMEADTVRALIASGRRVVMVADSTKWGVVGISTFAQLSEADILVTDEGLSAEAATILAEQVGELMLAGPADLGDELDLGGPQTLDGPGGGGDEDREPPP